MAKLFLSVAIVCFTCFLGWFFSLKFRKIKDFYLDFCDWNDRFLTELRYARRPLGEIIEQIPNKREFYREIRACVMKGEKASLSFLSAEERAYCENYFSALGKGDALSQQGFFSAQSEKLKQRGAESAAAAKKQTELYVKLGFLGGLALVVILI